MTYGKWHINRETKLWCGVSCEGLEQLENSKMVSIYTGYMEQPSGGRGVGAE